MAERLSLIAVVLLTACSTSSAPTDASSSSSAPPPPPASSARNDCVWDAGLWQCALGRTYPACDSNLRSRPSGACDGGACYYCIDGLAGATCNCRDDGDGGNQWLCIGTGYGCRP